MELASNISFENVNQKLGKPKVCFSFWLWDLLLTFDRSLTSDSHTPLTEKSRQIDNKSKICLRFVRDLLTKGILGVYVSQV
ncbi:MAG: hypothetical protein EOO34_00255 [Cyanobacteriota bacterium]|nr:MAG: hypothetical protein EOO34_00255 [Cyanobacteriota bacterium]